MQVSQTTSRPDKDYVILREMVEQSRREILDVHSKITQTLSRVEEFEQKLQMVDTIQGLQSKFEDMFRVFIEKSASLSQKFENLEKWVRIDREDTIETQKSFEALQKLFADYQKDFQALNSSCKSQIDSVQAIYSKALDKVQTVCTNEMKSLSDKLAVSPQQIWDQNEAHNSRLSKILEQTTQVLEETRKLKVFCQVLQNQIDTLRKKAAA